MKFAKVGKSDFSTNLVYHVLPSGNRSLLGQLRFLLLLEVALESALRLLKALASHLQDELVLG